MVNVSSGLTSSDRLLLTTAWAAQRSENRRQVVAPSLALTPVIPLPFEPSQLEGQPQSMQTGEGVPAQQIVLTHPQLDLSY